MTEQRKNNIDTRKLSPRERFRIHCPEAYERLLAEKVKELPQDKQALFFRLALRNNEQHIYV